MLKFAHVLAELEATPCAVEPTRLMSFHRYLLTRSSGIAVATAQAAFPSDHDGPAAAKPGRETAKSPGAVAVINVFGVVQQHPVMDICGETGVSTERLTARVNAALADPNVKAVVLNIDSPGGSVFGVPEAAAGIFNSRGAKPIIAVANSFAASAAYWLASAADELVVTPSGQVGSIGVYSVHQDWSTAYEEAGVRHTLIKAGTFKAETLDIGPLTDEARDHMQESVDSYYADFIKAVAKYRGATVETVRETFGQGRMVRAADAVKLGMADRVETLAETLKRLGASSQAQQASARAEDAASPVAEQADMPPSTSTEDPDADRETRERRHRHRKNS